MKAGSSPVGGNCVEAGSSSAEPSFSRPDAVRSSLNSLNGIAPQLLHAQTEQSRDIGSRGSEALRFDLSAEALQLIKRLLGLVERGLSLRAHLRRAPVGSAWRCFRRRSVRSF